VKNSVQFIFDTSTGLIGVLGKAIIHFRKGAYDKALSIVAGCMGDVRVVSDAIIEDREYFELVSIDSILEMLSGIVEAQKNRDYVLLADLIDLQIINFLINVQEMIMGKEDLYTFDVGSYNKSIWAISDRIVNVEDAIGIIERGLDSEELIDKGYRVEFTSSGCMTLAMNAPDGCTYYIHSNHIVMEEAYLTAEGWYGEDVGEYIVFGFGMGYVISELMELIGERERVVTVYEPDMNVLKLSCGFSGLYKLFDEARLRIVYDPDCSRIMNAISNVDINSKVCVFYPAYRSITDERVKRRLTRFLPWADAI